ncbi:BTAD domain-containing putative transcriptional regulator [Streptomyces microflavus]|uniref:BTAD domain-containing putative transcriptional regulator n=1 Tax=Streptomyces microflavus TaxID=1919 RepID=UPI0038245F62
MLPLATSLGGTVNDRAKGGKRTGHMMLSTNLRPMIGSERGHQMTADEVVGKLRFTLLNGVTAQRDGSAVPLGPPQRRALLCALALRRRQWVSVHSLLEALYDEDAPLRANKVIQTHVSALRRVLEPPRPARTPPGVLLYGHGGYQLRVSDEQLDLSCFERLVAEAERARAQRQWQEANDHYARALDLFSGEPLAGVPGPYAERRRDSLTERRLVVLEDSLENAITGGRAEQVVDRLRLAASEHPLRERLHGLLMQALYAGGRQSEALDVYRRTRHMLLEQLGVEPSGELRALHTRILVGKELPPPHSYSPTQTQAVVPGRSAAVSVPAPEVPALGGPAPVGGVLPEGMPGWDDAPLCVGRGAEIGRITALATRVSSGSGGLVIVSGGAGSGKSLLLGEAVRRLPAARWMSLSGADAEPALVRGLRDALELSPQSAPSPPVGVDARQLSDWALRTLDGARAPVVLFADDVQEADSASREALALMARGLSHRSVLLVLSVSDVPLDDPGAAWCAALETHARVVITLGPLDVAAIAALALRRLHTPRLEDTTTAAPPPTSPTLAPLATSVHDITGGLPALVVALLSDLDPVRHRDGITPDLVANHFTRALCHLLHRQDPTEALLLKALAVLAAHETDLETLAAVCEQPPSATRQVCADMVRRGILASAEPPRLRHPLVGAALLRSCTPGDRDRINVSAARHGRLTHRPARETAALLADLSGTQWAPWATTLVDAANDCLRDGAGAQAIRYLEAGARITAPTERAAVLLRLGQAELHTNPNAARLHLQEALQIQRDRSETPLAVVPLAWVMVSQGQAEAAVKLMNAVTAEADVIDPRAALALRGAGWLIACLTPGTWHELLRGIRASPAHRVADDPVATALLVCDDATRLRITAQETLDRFPTARTVDGAELPRALNSLLASMAMWCDRISLVEELCEQPSDQDFAAVDLYRVMLRTEMALRRGDHRRALDECRLLAGVPLDQVVRRPIELVAMYARALLGLGRLDEAEWWLDSVSHYADRESWSWTVVLYVRGMLSSAQGDPERAAASFLESGRRIALWGVTSPGHQTWQCSAALELARLGRHKEARDLAEEALDVAVRWGAPRFIGLAWQAMAATSPAHERITLLQKAIGFLEQAESPIDVATAVTDLAEAWTGAGAPERARPLLRRARKMAENLHATLLLRRITAVEDPETHNRGTLPESWLAPVAPGTVTS